MYFFHPETYLKSFYRSSSFQQRHFFLPEMMNLWRISRFLIFYLKLWNRTIEQQIFSSVQHISMYFRMIYKIDKKISFLQLFRVFFERKSQFFLQFSEIGFLKKVGIFLARVGKVSHCYMFIFMVWTAKKMSTIERNHAQL